MFRADEVVVFYTHITDEKVEAQRDEATSLRDRGRGKPSEVSLRQRADSFPRVLVKLFKRSDTAGQGQARGFIQGSELGSSTQELMSGRATSFSELLTIYKNDRTLPLPLLVMLIRELGKIPTI